MTAIHRLYPSDIEWLKERIPAAWVDERIEDGRIVVTPEMKVDKHANKN